MVLIMVAKFETVNLIKLPETKSRQELFIKYLARIVLNHYVMGKLLCERSGGGAAPPSPFKVFLTAAAATALEYQMLIALIYEPNTQMES